MLGNKPGNFLSPARDHDFLARSYPLEQAGVAVPQIPDRGGFHCATNVAHIAPFVKVFHFLRRG
jgi:hypothetical protein